MKNILKSLLLVIILISPSLGETITIYNWRDYIDTEILKDFTAKTGIGIDYKIYENNDDLYEILQKENRCDLIFPSKYYFKLLKEKGYLKKIDYKKIEGIHRFDPYLLHHPKTKEYGIPYFWGSTAIVYNSAKLEITSIRDLWREDLKKRLVITNDMRDMFAFALSSLGLNPNSEKEEDIHRAYKKLVALIPNIAGFNNNIERLALWFNNENIYAAIAYNGDVKEMIKENHNLEFVYPKEGGIIWTDLSAMCSGSKNIEESYLFLNYLYSDSVITKNTEELGYIPPTKNTITDRLTYPNEREKRDAIELIKIDKSYGTYEMYWEKFIEKLSVKGITIED